MASARVRAGLLAAVVALAVVVVVVSPAELGPGPSAAVIALTCTLLALALVRGSTTARVALASTAGVVGAIVGVGAWCADRYPGNQQLASAIEAVVPDGYREDTGARDECDGFGCSPYVTRSYVGARPITLDELRDRLRRSCYGDAAIRSAPTGEYVEGTCRSRNVILNVSVSICGPETVIRLYADRR